MKRSIQLLIAGVLCSLAAAGAFAQTEDDRQAQRVRGVNVVVASPRAALVPVPFPQVTDAQDTPWSPVGAAWNFAQPDMTVRMQLGSVLRVKLSDEIEGVWYPRACGGLGTLLVLEMQDPSGTSDEWIELGRDGASDYRCGPSVGTANVRVRYRPERPGSYLLRARIITYAKPAHADLTNAAELASEPEVVVKSQVNIRLRVTRLAIAESIPYEEPATVMPEELLTDQ